MIEWSWRIEGKRRVWCGSWSDGARWPRAFERMEGTRVDSVSLYGRLPEIDLRLSNGLHLLSMVTIGGDSDRALVKRSEGNSTSVYVRAGRLCFDNVADFQRE